MKTYAPKDIYRQNKVNEYIIKFHCLALTFIYPGTGRGKMKKKNNNRS